MAYQKYTITGSTVTASYQWRGGLGHFAATGTFGSGSVKLQHSLDGTNWLDSDSSGTTLTRTAAGSANFTLPTCLLRIQSSGTTGGTSIVAVIQSIGG